MDKGYPFNVRVYGILLDATGRKVLLSKEAVKGRTITKFPGGGLEFGEGPEDCVVREFLEETDLNVSVEAHYYTTGFFQVSAFDPEEQVISIYYRVVPSQEDEILDPGKAFFWKDLKTLSPEQFELPIDREVARMLIDRFSHPD